MTVLNKKTILLFILFSFFTISIYAQAYIHVGYNAGFPKKLDSLNYIIDRYNATRSYLDKQMKHINYLDGINITFGGVFDGLFIGMGYTGGTQMRYAEGVDITGNLNRRDVKVSTHVYDMEFGFAFADTDEGAVFAGSSMSLGKYNVLSRGGLATEVSSLKFEQINPGNSTYFTMGFFLRFCIPNPGIYIQPYYQFGGNIVTNDMTDVNKFLNKNTWQNDDSPLNVKNNVFGIKAGFSFLFGGD